MNRFTRTFDPKFGKGASVWAPPVLALLSMLVTGVCTGHERRVPSEYATIHDALAAAVSGDTVLVAPGSYSDFEVRILPTGLPAGALGWLVPNVTLRSEAGPDQTILDLAGQTSYFTFCLLAHTLDADSVVVDGFTCTGGAVRSNGMGSFFNPHLIVRNCRFLGLDAGSEIEDAGGGIRCERGDLTVEGCEFVDCRARTGGGLLHFISGDLYVTDCTFRECRGVGIYVNHVHPGIVRISDSSFFENDVGVGSSDTASTHVRSCWFERNSSPGSGAGVYVNGPRGQEPHRIFDCVFWNNSADGGGAIVWENSGGELKGNTFVGNHAPYGSVLGLSQNPGEDLIIRRNVFAYNTGDVPIRLGVSDSFDATGRCNLFWENDGSDPGDYVVSPHDVFADPMFCDLINGSELLGSFTVAEQSPCLPANSPTICDLLIGARGEACSDISVASQSWGAIKSLYRPTLETNDRKEP